MPWKYKLYYTFAIYLLLWCTAILLMISFYYFIDSVHGEGQLWFFIAWLASIAGVVKAVFSMRAVRHYKRQTAPGKREKLFFTIFFATNIIFAAGIAWLSIAEIIPSDFRSTTDYEVPLSARLPQLALDFSFFIACLFSIYLAIFDLPLLKALEKRHYDDLLNFDFDADQPGEEVL